MSMIFDFIAIFGKRVDVDLVVSTIAAPAFALATGRNSTR
jgi:hypothetical protein